MSHEADDAPTLAHEDAGGNLWFVNGRYELRLAGAGGVLEVTQGPWPGGSIHALYTDREGNTWVGSSGGLTRLRRHSFKAYTTADGLSNETAWTVFEDGRGDLWVGTNDGLNRVRDGRFTTYGTKRDGRERRRQHRRGRRGPALVRLDARADELGGGKVHSLRATRRAPRGNAKRRGRDGCCPLRPLLA